MGANLSGANTIFVNSSDDIKNGLIENILNYNLTNIESNLNTYEDKNLNVLIPMAGEALDFLIKGMYSPNH